LLLTAASYEAGVLPLADTPYIPSLPAATNRIDSNWFKNSGFIGKDVTLHFQVPANYVGPAVVPINLIVDAVEDPAGNRLTATTSGTSVNVFQSYVDAVASDSGSTARTIHWVTGSPLIAWSTDTPGVTANPDRATVSDTAGLVQSVTDFTPTPASPLQGTWTSSGATTANRAANDGDVASANGTITTGAQAVNFSFNLGAVQAFGAVELRFYNVNASTNHELR